MFVLGKSISKTRKPNNNNKTKNNNNNNNKLNNTKHHNANADGETNNYMNF